MAKLSKWKMVVGKTQVFLPYQKLTSDDNHPVVHPLWVVRPFSGALNPLPDGGQGQGYQGDGAKGGAHHSTHHQCNR